MEYTKLLVDGSWVNRGTYDEPNWNLMIYPIVTKIEPGNGIVGSFVLLESDKCISRPWYDSINRLFSRTEPSRDISLHNFGDFTDKEGREWQLFLTTVIPHVKSGVYATQAIKGYVFLDDIKPKDTGDDLDMWIYDSLKKLTGPKTISFKKEG